MTAPPEEAGVHYFVVLPTVVNTDDGKPTDDANKSGSSNASRQVRIGIRRYAGLFCNNCHVSLLKEGEESARFAGKVHNDQCALCGATRGVGKSSIDSPITECNSFDWYMAPHRLQQCFALHKVIDSYGTSFTVPFFLEKLVSKCPIQFYDKIDH